MADLPSTLLGVAMAFQQGMEARQQGRMADAVERFSEVITAGVDAPDFRNVARIERARAFDALGQEARAREDLLQVFNDSDSSATRDHVLAVLVETGGSPAEWLPRQSAVEAVAAYRTAEVDSLRVLRQSVQTNRLTATVAVLQEGRTVQAELEVRKGVWNVRGIRVARDDAGPDELKPVDPRLLAEGRGEALDELPALTSALLTHAAARGGRFPGALADLDAGIRRLPGGWEWTHPGSRKALPYLFRMNFRSTPDSPPGTWIAAAPLPWRGFREGVDLAGQVSLVPEAEFRAAAAAQGWEDPGLFPKELASAGVRGEMIQLEKALSCGPAAGRSAAKKRLQEIGPPAKAWLCEWLDGSDPELQAVAEEILLP